MKYSVTTGKKLEYSYFPQDVDGDGKTDLVVHKQSDKLFAGYLNQSNSALKIYKLNAGQTGLWSMALEYEDDYDYGFYEIPRWGTTLGVSQNVNTQQNTLYYITGDKIIRNKFTLNNQDETLLRKVSHKGLVQDVYYQPLRSLETGIYKEDNSQVYPYNNINTALGLQLVEKVIATANGQQAHQKFQYGGAVSHAGGLGFLGFMTTARTNTYGANVPTLWNVSQHDPQKRGAITQSWTSIYSSLDLPPTYSQKTDYEYTTQLLDNKIFINVPDAVTTQDHLMGLKRCRPIPTMPIIIQRAFSLNEAN